MQFELTPFHHSVRQPLLTRPHKETTAPVHAPAYPRLDVGMGATHEYQMNDSTSSYEPSAIRNEERINPQILIDQVTSSSSSSLPMRPIAAPSSESLSGVRGDGAGATGGNGPFVWKEAKCSRSLCCYTFLGALILTYVFLVCWLMACMGGWVAMDQTAAKEETNLMVDQVQIWTAILHEPLEAGYELQQNLAQKSPQLLSTTPISADVFNMTTLQTTPGWLSGFAEVAAKHPHLRSFGMMAILNSNDTTSPRNQIYIEYTKSVNGASLDAAGQVMIQMNTADQQLLAFSPNKSLHPTSTNDNGFNQFFPSDVMYSDSSADIAAYLGQSTSIISNHTFDLTTTATFLSFQQFLQANQTIGYLASQPPTNFNGGLRMIAAANNPIQSSVYFLTFAGYSTGDMNHLLSTIPIYSGDAFLISPQGGIIASTTGMEGSNLWSLDDSMTNDIRDFLFDAGLIINSSTPTLPYQSGLRRAFINGDSNYPIYTCLAQMIPGLPDNSQLSLVVRLNSKDLYDQTSNTIFFSGSAVLWVVGSCILLGGLPFVWSSFHRLIVTASAVSYYYSQDGRRDGRENCIDLLKLVHGWKLNSRTNRPIPPRVAELITVFIPQPVRRPAKGELLLENPPRIDECMSRFDDLAWLNDLMERWLYEFVETECAKHIPQAIPLPPLLVDEEMKSG